MEKQVKEFHEAFGHPVSEPERCNQSLRLHLIAEEFIELMIGCGFPKDLKGSFDEVMARAIEVAEDGETNLVEIADALGDLNYVITGFAVELGIPFDEVCNEIHTSNMTKLGEDGKPIYRDDGKVLKGPNYRPPNVKKVLDEHGLL